MFSKRVNLSEELKLDIIRYLEENLLPMPEVAKRQVDFEGAEPIKRGPRMPLFSSKNCKPYEIENPEYVECEKEFSPMLMECQKSRSLDDVISNLDKSFMEMVFSFADEKGITDAELQKKANIDRRAFSKLRCGTTRNPSKPTALALAIGLELNLDETKDLLSRAGMAISPCSKLDLIVQYFIEHEAYDIDEINSALYEHGEAPLGSGV